MANEKEHSKYKIPAWISNYMPSKVQDIITYPFPDFNGCTVEVWQRTSTSIVMTNFGPGIYQCWLFICEVLQHSQLVGNFTASAQTTILYNEFEKYSLKSPRGQWVNSSFPSAAYMHQRIRSALVQIMACHLCGTKPLSKPILGNWSLDP